MDIFQYATTPTTIAVMLGVVLIVCLTLYGKLRPIYIDAAKRIAREVQLRFEVTKQGEAIEDLVGTLGALRSEITGLSLTMAAIRTEVREMKLESNKSHAAILKRMARLEAYAEDNGKASGPAVKSGPKRRPR